ncbi:MAG: hypothetical protein V9F00_03530 [Nocardioides sp.]
MAGGGSITVESSDDACTLSATEAPAGSITFAVKNTGNDVTEFYIYAEDGETIVSRGGEHRPRSDPGTRRRDAHAAPTSPPASPA